MEEKDDRYNKGWSSATGVQRVGGTPSKTNPVGLDLNSTTGSSKPKTIGPDWWVYIGSKPSSTRPSKRPKSLMSFPINQVG